MAVKHQEFLLRRLHSLTGMAPMGLFLFEHFFTNSYSHQGEAVFNEKVHFLQSLPYILFIEWGVLFLPFLFHMFYGLYIIYTAQHNVQTQGHTRNWLYFLQRVTAIPAFFFVVYHVATTRFWDHGADPNFYRIMTHKFESLPIVAIYVVGIVCVCFHFANGICTFCMTWGITVTPASQRAVGLACAVIGFVLTGMAINSIFGFTAEGFATRAVQEAPKVTSWFIQAFTAATS